jgi:hypothetical protein
LQRDGKADKFHLLFVETGKEAYADDKSTDKSGAETESLQEQITSSDGVSPAARSLSGGKDHDTQKAKFCIA